MSKTNKISLKKKYLNKCQICEEKFRTIRSWQKFCSPECRKKHYKQYSHNYSKNRYWTAKLNNPEKLRETRAKYKESKKKYSKMYRKKNPERTREIANRRLKRKFNAEGSHTYGEWELLKKQYGFTCPSCKSKEPEIKLTEDHIIPLSKGGSDYIENIQPLCRSCNSSKSTKVVKY